MIRSLLRRAPVWLAAGLTLFLIEACQHADTSGEPARVVQAFTSWKQALLDHHAATAMAYLPHNVDRYLATIKAAPAANSPASPHPTVDLYLRRALAEKVPSDLRANLTLATLLQRITDRNLIKPRDLQALTLGAVSVDGDHAGADVYYDGMITAVRLSFFKEDGAWKIDVLGLLPYAETLLSLDRLVKNQGEEQQINELVAKLPSL
jgi:hypothetical protein